MVFPNKPSHYSIMYSRRILSYFIVSHLQSIVIRNFGPKGLSGTLVLGTKVRVFTQCSTYWNLISEERPEVKGCRPDGLPTVGVVTKNLKSQTPCDLLPGGSYGPGVELLDIYQGIDPFPKNDDTDSIPRALPF